MPSCNISQKHKNTSLSRGAGALHELDKILPNFKKILVFTDKNGFHPCGAATYFEKIESKLQGKVNFHYFPYIGKALPLEDIEEIYKQVRLINEADLIIAIGGGTVIDLAKIIAIAYSNRCAKVDEIVTHGNLQNTLTLIFIPTTAGTGSEATAFAVVYRDKVKLSIDNKSVLPDYVVLDPLLLQSLPEEVLNSVILDALAQGVESTWARATTTESQQYAREAIGLIYKHYDKPPSIERLDALLWASHLAGKAINISRTTLSHSISYPITAHFGVPHGIAVFLTLPTVTRFNYETEKNSLQTDLDYTHIKNSFAILFQTFQVATINELVVTLQQVMTKFKLSLHLRDYGIQQKDLPFIAQHGITQGRSDNNPRQATIQTVLTILTEIF